MSSPYIGEIRMFGGSFAPAGWAFCAGQLMPISQNDTLFNLIGTTYGGDGQETFGIPDLQGRFPMHQGTLSGTTFQIGEMAGSESVTLTTQQIPVHSHAATASTNAGDQSTPQNNTWATKANAPTVYGTQAGAGGMSAMNNQNIGIAGGSQPHENMQPFLVVSFILSLFGIFPTQN